MRLTMRLLAALAGAALVLSFCCGAFGQSTCPGGVCPSRRPVVVVPVQPVVPLPAPAIVVAPRPAVPVARAVLPPYYRHGRRPIYVLAPQPQGVKP
jgi:hypothetical protein